MFLHIFPSQFTKQTPVQHLKSSSSLLPNFILTWQKINKSHCHWHSQCRSFVIPQSPLVCGPIHRVRWRYKSNILALCAIFAHCWCRVLSGSSAPERLLSSPPWSHSPGQSCCEWPPWCIPCCQTDLRPSRRLCSAPLCHHKCLHRELAELSRAKHWSPVSYKGHLAAQLTTIVTVCFSSKEGFQESLHFQTVRWSKKNLVLKQYMYWGLF